MSGILKFFRQFSKGIVVVSFILLVSYTMVALYFSWHDRQLPQDLTVSVFRFFGTEMVALMMARWADKVAEFAQSKRKGDEDGSL